MDVRVKITPRNMSGEELLFAEGEYIFFKVAFNAYRDTSGSTSSEVTDREDIRECECVLRLPEGYTDDGEPTQLVIFCHGAGGRVSLEDRRVGGLVDALTLLDSGYAMLDVCGAEPHGLTMGNIGHITALYRAYSHAVRNYNLTERVLLGGASMGGTTAMNFLNAFPSLVIAAGLYYPRLNIDGVTVGEHYCIGTWDKTERRPDGISTKERVAMNLNFPSLDEWCEENTVGFNPYRTRSFINGDGERVVIPPCPIKIWQGLDDNIVDPVMTEEFVRSVRRSGSYIELHKLEGVGHYPTDTMKREICMWFDRFRLI